MLAKEAMLETMIYCSIFPPGTVNSARQSVDSPMTGSPAADPSHDSPALLFYPSPATSEQSGQTLNQQQSPPIVPSAPVTSQGIFQ